MRVYHFLNEEYGLKDIRGKRLKISNLLELNDPFEFYSLELSDRDFRKSIKVAKITAAKDFGVICFSAKWTNPVQWAHYANRHKGICLGFNISKSCLEKVKYITERVTHNGELTESSVIELLKTKFEDWSYEEEYRAFVPLEEAERGIYYSDFNKNLILKQVIVGAESNITRKEINDSLGELNKNLEVFKVRPAFKTFKMVRNKDEKQWA